MRTIRGARISRGQYVLTLYRTIHRLKNYADDWHRISGVRVACTNIMKGTVKGTCAALVRVDENVRVIRVVRTAGRERSAIDLC